MNGKTIAVLCLVFFGIGTGLGRYLTPTNSTQIDNTKKGNSTEKEVKDIVTTRPDGTKIVEHVVTVIRTEIQEHIVTKITESKKPDWKASALVGYSLDNIKPVYGLDVQRRILGSASVGIWGTTEKTVGISIGYEF